jgi:hypothetical protein
MDYLIRILDFFSHYNVKPVNKGIDYFIQNTQSRRHLLFELVSMGNFSAIEEIGKGGYTTVFGAKTKVGLKNGIIKRISVIIKNTLHENNERL